MIDAAFEFPDVLGAYVDQLQRTPQAVEVFLNGTVRNYLDQRREIELGYVPGSVAKPVEWTPAAVQNKPANVNYGGNRYYSKQKAAYFATDGFGGGIPSTRTDAIANSWQTVIDLQTLTAGYINNHPATKFLLGTFQQRFHANTGWRREDLIALEIMASPVLNDILVDGWLSIVDIEQSLI